MSVEVDIQEILIRLKSLEDENIRLRKGAYSFEEKPLKITEGEIRGNPSLFFEGPCKSFKLGLKQISTIKLGWPEVESFLERHLDTQVSQASIEYDIKI